MNAQEIFDTVAKHLAAQGGPARNGMSCYYRAPDGRKCAVGCLIDDVEYRSEMDYPSDSGKNTETHVRALYQRDLLPERLGDHLDLLEVLQATHDKQGQHVVQTGLSAAAQRFGLSPAILDTLTFPERWA